MQKSAANQLLNKVALVAGTRLVNFQASAATYLSADLFQPQAEVPSKLGRASAIYLNKISMIYVCFEMYTFKCVCVGWYC
jgi:hypothetical protein